MTQHTPGPWRAFGAAVITADDKLHVASAYSADMRRPAAGEMEANARLIASAPELLAALNDLWGNAVPQTDAVNGEVKRYAVPRAIMDRARAAIAKATGDAC